MDSFNVPMYTPSAPEVEALIKLEGSFIIHRLETYAVSWDPDVEDKSINQTLGLDQLESGVKVVKYMRAVAEPLLSSHFGEAIMDDLFQRYRDILSHHMQREDPKFINLVISIEKR